MIRFLVPFLNVIPLDRFSGRDIDKDADDFPGIFHFCSIVFVPLCIATSANLNHCNVLERRTKYRVYVTNNYY
jgi:hypothetical protein